jgi:murein DD-endopeptidase MepM/ murein hydrolase activator NlpD
MDWPSAGAALISNFGVNDRGGPNLGTTFSGDGVVHAAETGELLFVKQGPDTASRIPSPLGTWAAIDHGDGLISVYSRLDDKKRLSLPKTIEKNMGIAEMGISGWSKEKGFHFSLFDRKERRWVNPAMIISRLPDSRPPVIQAVRLQSAASRNIDVSQLKSSISQGRYTVFVNIADLTATGESALAPFRIICSVNGREIGALTFETFSARDGRLLIYRNGLMPVKEVYADYPAFEMGEVVFTRGQASLEVIAQDINENSYTAVYKFSVD